MVCATLSRFWLRMAKLCLMSPSENICNTQLESVKRASGIEPKDVAFLTDTRFMLTSEAEIMALKPTHCVPDEYQRGSGAVEIMQEY